MKTACFVLSGVLALLGLATLITTGILNRVLPKLGRVAYQSAAAGSYTPTDYLMDFRVINILAICMIAVGLAAAAYIYKKN